MPPVTHPTLDPRIVRTRQLLREALVALLEEKDFEVITVQDIADRATVNRATVYAHYQDKYDLLADAIREAFCEVLYRWMNQSIPVSDESPRQMLLAVCDFVRELDEKCNASNDGPRNRLCEPFLESQVKEVLRELLIPWLQSIHPEGEAEMKATLWSWSIYASAWEWLYRQRAVPLEEFADQAISMIQGGLK